MNLFKQILGMFREIGAILDFDPLFWGIRSWGGDGDSGFTQ